MCHPLVFASQRRTLLPGLQQARTRSCQTASRKHCWLALAAMARKVGMMFRTTHQVECGLQGIPFSQTNSNISCRVVQCVQWLLHGRMRRHLMRLGRAHPCRQPQLQGPAHGHIDGRCAGHRCLAQRERRTTFRTVKCRMQTFSSSSNTACCNLRSSSTAMRNLSRWHLQATTLMSCNIRRLTQQVLQRAAIHGTSLARRRARASP